MEILIMERERERGERERERERERYKSFKDRKLRGKLGRWRGKVSSCGYFRERKRERDS